MTVGFCVTSAIERPKPELISHFSTIRSTDISDAMHCSGTMERQIRPMFGEMPRVVGPAVTVSIPTMSMNILKAGFQQLHRGDVLVVNGMGNTATAVIGGNMLRELRERDIAGIIIDGVIRDISEAREVGLPVFARGITTATGPEGPDAGEVNTPIACGRVVVNPGDIVVADEDGSVVVSPAVAEEVLKAVLAMEAKRTASQEILNGVVMRSANVEQQLRDAGCIFVGEPAGM